MKNPKEIKWLAAVPLIASTVFLTLSAAPAAAVPWNHFELSEQCNYFPAPTNALACFSQSGQVIRTHPLRGNPATYVSVTTSSTVHYGPSKAGTRLAQSTTTQIRTAVAGNGQPAVVRLWQVVRAANYAAPLWCTFYIQLEIVGEQVRNTRTDIKCA